MPAQLALGLGGIATDADGLVGAVELLVHDHVVVPIEPDATKGNVEHLANCMRRATGQDVIVGLVTLEHECHATHGVARERPVALGIEIAESQLSLISATDLDSCLRDLARHEIDGSPRRLVVEENPRRGV